VRVLVTGHHGYIGSVMVTAVGAAGHEVVGLDTYLYEGCDFGLDVAHPVDAIRADVRDVGPEVLAGFDAVVHLAALSNDPIGDLRPDWTRDINFAATVRLARLAKEAGVGRFVFASSCSLYGSGRGDEAVDEDTALRPLTPYAESKARSEEALLGMADGDFAPTSMRNATAYGASPRLRLDVVLNNLVAWAHTTGRVRLASDGSAWRPLVHIRDIARATVALLDAPPGTAAGRAFNIGSDEQNYRIRDLAEVVRERLPSSVVELAEGASPDARSYRVDFRRFSAAFPTFRCEWSAASGADELATAYEKAGLTRERFESSRFFRLDRLKELLAVGSLDDRLRWHVQAEPLVAAGMP
jgi:nucleoside-diphosphate-sugar epimerase